VAQSTTPECSDLLKLNDGCWCQRERERARSVNLPWPARTHSTSASQSCKRLITFCSRQNTLGDNLERVHIGLYTVRLVSLCVPEDNNDRRLMRSSVTVTGTWALTWYRIWGTTNEGLKSADFQHNVKRNAVFEFVSFSDCKEHFQRTQAIRAETNPTYALYPRRQAWVGCSSPSVCLSVCLFVWNITQKRKIPKCSKLGYPRNGMVWRYPKLFE